MGRIIVSWTPAMIAEMRQLQARGWQRTQIAKHMATTYRLPINKNMVIGQLNKGKYKKIRSKIKGLPVGIYEKQRKEKKKIELRVSSIVNEIPAVIDQVLEVINAPPINPTPKKKNPSKIAALAIAPNYLKRPNPIAGPLVMDELPTPLVVGKKVVDATTGETIGKVVNVNNVKLNIVHPTFDPITMSWFLDDPVTHKVIAEAKSLRVLLACLPPGTVIQDYHPAGFVQTASDRGYYLGKRSPMPMNDNSTLTAPNLMNV